MIIVEKAWRAIVVTEPEAAEGDDSYQGRNRRPKQQVGYPLGVSVTAKSKSADRLDTEMVYAIRTGRAFSVSWMCWIK